MQKSIFHWENSAPSIIYFRLLCSDPDPYFGIHISEPNLDPGGKFNTNPCRSGSMLMLAYNLFSFLFSASCTGVFKNLSNCSLPRYLFTDVLQFFLKCDLCCHPKYINFVPCCSQPNSPTC